MMDTSKKYIEMCQKATEIQKRHKPQHGDFWVCGCKSCCDDRENRGFYTINDYDMDYLNKRDMANVEKGYTSMVGMSGVGGFGAFRNEGGYIWLPRQDQLQKAWIKEYEKHPSKLGWFGEFYEFVGSYYWIDNEIYLSDKGLNADEYFASMEQLWLAFVMKEVYRKSWNGGEWAEYPKP